MTKEKELFRIFLGTFIEDKDFFESLHQYQPEMENTSEYKIRWVKDPNIHMTWKFLGDISESRIERTITSIENCITTFKPMILTFDRLEIWPKASSPRQFVLSGYDLNNNIDSNSNILEKTLKDIGFKPENRRFKPHITLGRFKIKHKLREPIILQDNINIKINAFELSKIALVKSDLLPEGPKYQLINTFSI